jgi:hypothetical protein
MRNALLGCYAPRCEIGLGISHRPDGRLKPMRADAIERALSGAV